MENLDFQLATFLILAQNILMTWGLKVLGAIAVLIVGRIIAGGVRRSLDRFMKRSETDATLAKFLSSLVYYLVHGKSYKVHKRYLYNGSTSSYGCTAYSIYCI